MCEIWSVVFVIMAIINLCLMFTGLSFGDTRIKDVINRIQSCSSPVPALAVT